MFPSSPPSILCIELPALCIFTIAKMSFMSHDDPCTLTAHSFTVHDLNSNALFCWPPVDGCLSIFKCKE